MSVFSLSMSVGSLPRPHLPELGSHTFSLNCMVSDPYIVCALVAGYSDDITQVLTPVSKCTTPAK